MNAHPGALAALSGTTASASFVMSTLPYLQWFAALVAGLSGILAIIVAIQRMRK